MLKNISAFSCNSEILQYQQIIHIPGCIPCWSYAEHFYQYSVITPQLGWLTKNFIDPKNFLSPIRQEAGFFLCAPRHFSKPTPDIFGPTYMGMHPGSHMYDRTALSSCRWSCWWRTLSSCWLTIIIANMSMWQCLNTYY